MKEQLARLLAPPILLDDVGIENIQAEDLHPDGGYG